MHSLKGYLVGLTLSLMLVSETTCHPADVGSSLLKRGRDFGGGDGHGPGFYGGGE